MALTIIHSQDLVDYLQQMIQPYILQEDKHMSLIISLVETIHSTYRQVLVHIMQVIFIPQELQMLELQVE